MNGRGQTEDYRLKTEDQNGVSGDVLGSLERLHAAYPQCGCVSLTPAEKWDFGTVVGNGSQGALAFCRPYNDELVLSHEELFLPLYPFRGYLPVREHFEDPVAVFYLVHLVAGMAKRALCAADTEGMAQPETTRRAPTPGTPACITTNAPSRSKGPGNATASVSATCCS
jgi:hypothetical protein